MFALISDGLDPSGSPAKVVRELFAADPALDPSLGFDIREVAAGVAIGWIAHDDGTIAAYTAPAPTKDDLKAYAESKRFEIETAGITVDGASIETTRDSQNMISNAYAYMVASGAESASYKAASGWVTLPAAQMKVVALAVGAHVQACYSKEMNIDAAIDRGTVATLGGVDAAFASGV